MKKIAISLPDDQAKSIEELRRKRKVPRSRVIQQAVALYLAEQERDNAVRAYVEGYRRKPERPTEAIGLARAAAAVLGEEDWE